MNPKTISPEDLTLYALQLLPEAEVADAIIHLEHNEAARAEIAAVQGDLALYSLASAELHSPPALARERLLRRVAKEKKLVPRYAPAAESGEPLLVGRGERVVSIDDAPRRSGFFGWAGWAVAAGLAVFAGLQFHQRQQLQQHVNADSAHTAQLSADAARAQALLATLTNPAAMQVGLHLPATGAPETPKPEGHAAYIAESGTLVFVGTHLAPLEPYKTYELWVIPADGHDPIPAGTFKPDERGYASVVLPELPKGVPARTFGVTIEDDGGSKLPTPPIVLAGM
jgi:anti-sigma-K factor RskA